MTTQDPTPSDILNAALTLAKDRHWEAVRLQDVAEALGVSLVAIHAQIREKEDLVDLLWDEADQHMLATCQGSGFDNLDFPAQFETCVMTWLGYLAPFQTTVSQMLHVRLEPGHLHIQIPTLLRISRTVQWMRELCARSATFGRRAAEETVLTAVFVTTVVGWLTDSSRQSRRTRRRLARATRRAVRLGRLWPGAPDG